MGQQNVNYTLNENQSMGANFKSNWQNFDDYVAFSIQSFFTGTPDGELFLEISNQPVGSPAEVTDFSVLGGSNVLINGAGDVTWDVTSQVKWVRVCYTRTGGTGTFKSYVMAKEV